MSRSSATGLCLAGDLVLFLLFAVSGLHSHHEAFSVAHLIRGSGTFAACWAAIAYLVLPRLKARVTPSRLLAVAWGWPPAWATGFALRLLVFHRHFEAAFAVVSLVVLGLALVAWRIVLGRMQMADNGTLAGGS